MKSKLQGHSFWGREKQAFNCRRPPVVAKIHLKCWLRALFPSSDLLYVHHLDNLRRVSASKGISVKTTCCTEAI